MNTLRETFKKGERLCSNKVISGLFEDGSTFHTSLFKVVWQKSNTTLPFPAQVIFSVSKKGFRSAVIRNLIKRRMREAYRKTKLKLYEHLASGKIQIVFVLILKGNVVPDYSAIEKSIIEIIDRLIMLTDEN